MTSQERLRSLGSGTSIADLCKAQNWTRAEFDAWWQEECVKRVPAARGRKSLPGLSAKTRVVRDRWGIPHVFAENDRDLYFAYGYASAQDRLFQLDYLRRKARGRLAEIMGPEAVESDLLVRTVGIGRIADREWATLPEETRQLLQSFAAGINAHMEEVRANPPLEFDLLGYQPEAWHPTDSLAIEGEFRWYLTGRFPVIAIPEVARRNLGDGPLFREFILGEVDDESILQPGDYKPGPKRDVGQTASGDDAGGSNNWVIDGAHSTTGKPIVANDPHIPYFAVSIWHEVHLHGGSFNVAGVALAGMPAVMIGRNENVAWGITNNICMQRDLYLEKTDLAHPGEFLYDGKWEPATVREEVIHVRGQAPVRKWVTSSRNGPIVDDVLPAAIRNTGPVSVRWLGTEPCGWLPALLGMGRAKDAAEFCQACEPWLVPTFNIVYADRAGTVGMQTTGRIPVRQSSERGYRPGWDPAHQWQRIYDFAEMVHVQNPARGFIATANNRLAPNDYPLPLFGCWSSGHRQRRLRKQLESRKTWSAEEAQALQMDVVSGRAEEGTPGLLDVLAGESDARVKQAVGILSAWKQTIDEEAVGASLFNVFFTHWTKRVCSERFPAELVGFVSANAGGIALRLLQKDALGWFTKTTREQAIRQSFLAALDELTTRLGPDMTTWTWGRIHVLVQKHFLSGRGDLGTLLDRSGMPTRGDGATVCSGSSDANHASILGAGYRVVVDLADPKLGMWATEVAGTSGHPGSPHYDDQIEPWNAGKYHYLSLSESVDGREQVLHG